MPVETANYITDLAPANPLHTDGLGQADSHLRMIKQVLQNQFPNLGDVAVSATATQLNGVSAALSPGTVTVQPAPGSAEQGGQAVLKGVTAAGAPDITVTNVGTSGLAIAIGGLVVATCDVNGNWDFPASVSSATLAETGSQLLPAGFIGGFSGTLIPAGWALCNGTNGTPDLRDRFIVGAGNLYVSGATGGSAAATATDTQGSHSHTGDTGLAGGFTPTGVTDLQGYHAHTGATVGAALTGDQLPPHQHTFPTTPGPGGGGGLPYLIGSSGVQEAITDAAGSGNPHLHGISADGLHGHNLTVNAQPDHQHSISLDGSHAHNIAARLPPYYALAYIMKL